MLARVGHQMVGNAAIFALIAPLNRKMKLREGYDLCQEPVQILVGGSLASKLRRQIWYKASLSYRVVTSVLSEEIGHNASCCKARCTCMA